MSESSQRLFAFWKYDTYPFVIGDEVKKFTDEGMVVPVNYGGRTFRPVLVVPLEQGKAMNAKLRDLETQHRAAQRTFEEQWVHRIHEHLPLLIPGLKS